MAMYLMEFGYPNGTDITAYHRCRFYYCDLNADVSSIVDPVNGDLLYVDEFKFFYIYNEDSTFHWDQIVSIETDSPAGFILFNAGVISTIAIPISHFYGGTGIASIIGQAGKVLAVKGDESGYEFIASGGGGGGSSDLSMIASSNRNIAANNAGLALRKFTINSGIKLTVASGSIFRVL